MEQQQRSRPHTKENNNINDENLENSPSQGVILMCPCLNVMVKPGMLDKQPKTLGNYNKELFYPARLIKVFERLPGLVYDHDEDSHVYRKCYNCDTPAYATPKKSDDAALVSSNLLDEAAVTNVRNGINFSSIYGIKISTNYGNQTNIFTDMSPEEMAIVHKLKQTANESINSELVAVEERVKRYSEQQYADYEEYKSKVLLEHEAVSRKILECKRRTSKLNQSSTNPTSPVAAAPSEPAANVGTATSSTTSSSPSLSITLNVPENVESPRRSSLLDRPKITTSSSSSSPRSILSNRVRTESARLAGSIDSEGMFAFEEDDANNGDVTDDDDDYADGVAEDGGDGGNVADSDDETPNWIAARQRSQTHHQQQQRGFAHVAKSLPVTIPVMMSLKNHVNDDIDDGLLEDSKDIAASIRALAKSIQGDTTFGDLPSRPRFSSQI